MWSFLCLRCFSVLLRAFNWRPPPSPVTDSFFCLWVNSQQYNLSSREIHFGHLVLHPKPKSNLYSLHLELFTWILPKVKAWKTTPLPNLDVRLILFRWCVLWVQFGCNEMSFQKKKLYVLRYLKKSLRSKRLFRAIVIRTKLCEQQGALKN